MDNYSYINGICIAIYFAVCLLCGLQLVGHIFGSNRLANTIVSKLMGCVLLTWAGGALLYILYAMTEINGFAITGFAIDVAAFAGLACMAHVFYANQWPNLRTTLVLSLPYALIILLAGIYPHLFNEAFILVLACLLGQYLYYFRKLHRRELMLNDLYADPDRHSLRWLKTFACMYGGYWAVRICFVYTSLSPWCDTALYTVMTLLILFIYTKICTYGESVSLKTQKEIEDASSLLQDTHPPLSAATEQPPIASEQPSTAIDTTPTAGEQPPAAHHTLEQLNRLMTDKQIYLRHDLTIEEVAKMLNIKPKYLSAVLHNDMHTTFAQMINRYRIEYAQHLLLTTDDKIEYIGTLCGYNSRQVFINAFTALTGQTPAIWRKNRG